MMRALGLLSLCVLPQAAWGFLPLALAPASASQAVPAIAGARGAGPLGSSLFGGDDLLVGGKGKGTATDPAPGEFDLLGASAAGAPVIEQV